MEFGESISSQTICQHTQRSAQAQHLACTSSTSFVSSQESLLVHFSLISLTLAVIPTGQGLTILAAESCWAETMPAGRGLLAWLQARGSCAQGRGKRRKADFTPRRSCEPSEHRRCWVGMTAGYKAEGAGRAQTKANSTLAYSRWVASREREVVKKSCQFSPLQESQNLKCTHIWDFSTILPILCSLILLSFAKDFLSGNTLNNCSLASWKRISYTSPCSVFPLQFYNQTHLFSTNARREPGIITAFWELRLQDQLNLVWASWKIHRHFLAKMSLTNRLICSYFCSL